MNLFAAIETCNSLNSTLASIHGESHNDFLISMARSLRKAANTSFYALWIGFMNYEHAFEYMTGNCQYGWSWSDGSVVDYVIYNQSKVTYNEALQTCSAMNSSLAVLENQDEHQFIKGIHKF
uniref:C-type lectin domain-containing protein n=1 Tax=Acrobeloides nanus TaxID=290746 RepID=A0A914D0V1_9BILA